MNYILASQSPRRRELMKKITNEFSVMPSGADENLNLYFSEAEIAEALKNSPEKLVMKLAEVKALDIAKKHSEDIVIGSDTCVFIDGEVLGKPADEKDADRMLFKLSGKVHYVITGVAVCKGDIVKTSYEITKVKFNELTQQLVDSYIATGSPLDKAGAYGIQDEYGLIEGIEGELDNVVGFPVKVVKKLINMIV